jgi:hypothetical protein
MMAREEMDIEEEEMDGYLEQILYDSDSMNVYYLWYKLWEHFYNRIWNINSIWIGLCSSNGWE